LEALVAFGVILLAELGDKSQLIAVGFAARYQPWLVLAGIAAATLLINAASVILGSAFAAMLPTQALQIAGGLAFLFFAAWTVWRSDREEEAADRPGRAGRWVVLTIGVAYVVAEVGDKTMLAIVALAATANPVAIWVGASAAMIGANAIAILVAVKIGGRVPERVMRNLSVVAFLAFGTLLLLEGLNVL
jgi:putative Ca2+/H+ antiporter (TMEM165/GDT1 family)